MSTRLLALNVLVGLLGWLLAAGLVREVLVAHPLPPVPSVGAVKARPAAAPAPTPPMPEASYGVIVARNLFSPGRSEAPSGPGSGAVPLPILHGVVVDGSNRRAYLEDPVAKRTFGYTIGDSVGGGRVQSISDDRVVIARPDGPLEVLLQDPAKPKPLAAPVGAPGSTPSSAASSPRRPGGPEGSPR